MVELMISIGLEDNASHRHQVRYVRYRCFLTCLLTMEF